MTDDDSLYIDANGVLRFPHGGDIENRMAEICEEMAGSSDEEIEAALTRFLKAAWSESRKALN